MAAEVLLPIVIIALVMLLGFLGELIFKKTGIPSVVLLLLFGLFLGPMFNIVSGALFLELSELFAAIAIIIILFDGGLNLELYKVLRGAPRGTLLALLSFTVTVLTVTAITLASGFDMFTGVLLGAIVGGSSSPIVIPLVSKIKGVSEDTKTVLSIESAITDALCVVVVIALIQAFTLGTGALQAAQNIASAFSIGAVLGLVLGVGWVHGMHYLEDQDYSYLVTIAIAFMLYAATELLGGSGAIAMLMFGITLGNGKAVYNMLKYDNPFQINKRTRDFNALIAFIVRTFFFVYMGLLVSFTDPGFILFGVIAVIAITLMRPSAVQIAIFKNEKKLSLKHMSIMVPRGLAAAVLAFLPLNAGIPNASWFPDVVFTIILGTTIVTTIGAYWLQKEAEKEEQEKPKTKKKK